MLDGFHIGDHALGFQVLDCGAEDGIVEVRSRLDRLGPDSLIACFVDEAVHKLLLC